MNITEIAHICIAALNLLTSTNHDPIAAAQFDSLTPGGHTLTVRANTVGSAGVFVDCFDYIPAAGLPS